jgi:hypothetical protein
LSMRGRQSAIALARQTGGLVSRSTHLKCGCGYESAIHLVNLVSLFIETTDRQKVQRKADAGGKAVAA